jgi:hypothetical protein
MKVAELYSGFRAFRAVFCVCWVVRTVPKTRGIAVGKRMRGRRIWYLIQVRAL